ncbi:Presenilins-associated rhomboid-like protein, mitochondrial [Porphyridium purpureum]|uniref:Presenilins-associated rhomboid-like protein, mitochondrial n=1 Tax=Porphyridium purpureum TaxID=35688 RepID=A0A5J4YJZ0_PORPP|nr:Presenilins-associated rhomboid-like protein, mitochondrial [Porphyridium purpureum]|eukprot:POR5879..scf289_17
MVGIWMKRWSCAATTATAALWALSSVSPLPSISPAALPPSPVSRWSQHGTHHEDDSCRTGTPCSLCARPSGTVPLRADQRAFQQSHAQSVTSLVASSPDENGGDDEFQTISLANVVDEVLRRSFRVFRAWELDLVNDTRTAAPVLGLIAVNVGVYLAWKVLPARFMLKHFSTNSTLAFRLQYMHTLITSNFSHSSFIHLACNMFVLSHFGPVVSAGVGTYSPSAFVTMYVASGAVSSIASTLARRRFQTVSHSLGASGSVMAMLFWYEQLAPHQGVRVLGFDSTLQSLCRGLVVFDLMGVFNHWQIVDHAGHLGGALFGMALFQYMNETRPNHLNNVHFAVRRRLALEARMQYQVQLDERRVFQDLYRGGDGGMSKYSPSSDRSLREIVTDWWRDMTGRK